MKIGNLIVMVPIMLITTHSIEFVP